MFGLMTVARHEREDTDQRLRYEVWYAWQKERIEEAKAETAHWRVMAESLRADLADLRKRELPPVPGPEDSAVSSIDDGDREHTPTALRDRAKRAG